MTDTSEDGDFVGFELHARPTTEAKSASGQLISYLVDGDGQTSRKAFEDDNEGLAMGFTGGQITQHRFNLPACSTPFEASFAIGLSQPTNARLKRTVKRAPIAKNGPNGTA